MNPTDLFTEQVNSILSSKKYRDLGIPEETIVDLLEKEWQTGVKPKEALKLAKRKLHNIIAPYLGDPDYNTAQHELTNALASQDTGMEKEYCTSLLMSHASTRERLPHLAEFYQLIFNITGIPNILLDVACAMHPFSLPWMNLPQDIEYHAYDIHQPRLDLINHYFELKNLKPLAEKRDVLLNPPDVPADVAFLFKETHRMEKRERGCSLPLWQALHVDWLVVTLPAYSLTKEHDLRQTHRQLVVDIMRGQPWQMTETESGGEMIFCIHKQSKAI